MSPVDRLGLDGTVDSARPVAPSEVTPLLEQPYPCWYLDREGVVVGANLLACQAAGAERPGDLFGQVALRDGANALPAGAEVLPLVGGWGVVVRCPPDPNDRETGERFSVEYKRAIRLWGTRRYVQYDVARFGEYAYVMKEVGLSHHRARGAELAPHAVIDRVRAALEGPGVLWKRREQIARETGLAPDQVEQAIQCLVDFGGDVVGSGLLSRAGRGGYATRRRFARYAPRWLQALARIEDGRRRLGGLLRRR